MIGFLFLYIAVSHGAPCTVLTDTTETASASAAALVCGSNAECMTFGAECHVVYVFGDIDIQFNFTITAIAFPRLVNTTGYV